MNPIMEVRQSCSILTNPLGVHSVIHLWGWNCEALVTAVLIKTPDDPAEFMMKAAGRFDCPLSIHSKQNLAHQGTCPEPRIW